MILSEQLYKTDQTDGCPWNMIGVVIESANKVDISIRNFCADGFRFREIPLLFFASFPKKC